MEEAEKSSESYASIEELFTRALKPNSRVIKGSYVSSADGKLVISKALKDTSEALQAKGLTYKIQDLIYGREGLSQQGQRPAWYTTVYLAPHNYHRVHAPFAGVLKKLRYIPGELWPVNNTAVQSVPRLFVRNERLVFDFELANGGRAWVVMVGALNVGRMATPFHPDFVTNSAARQLSGAGKASELNCQSGQIALAAGDEIGVFMLGSTTVVVLDELAVNMLKPATILEPRSILMGESL